MRTITISGNLGKGPEIRDTQNGTKVANFSVAVRHNRADENGEYGTDWFRCTVWGNRANTIERFYHKGSHGVFTGDFETSEYNGNTQLEVNVREFDLPDSSSQQNEQSNHKPQQEWNNSTNNSQGDSIDITDDDLPF